LGSVGLLETFYARGYLTDRRACFRQLIIHNVCIDQRRIGAAFDPWDLPTLTCALVGRRNNRHENRTGTTFRKTECGARATGRVFFEPPDDWEAAFQQRCPYTRTM